MQAITKIMKIIQIVKIINYDSIQLNNTIFIKFNLTNFGNKN